MLPIMVLRRLRRLVWWYSSIEAPRGAISGAACGTVGKASRAPSNSDTSAGVSRLRMAW